jgi:clorobiocin biosynthesis protein CloN7
MAQVEPTTHTLRVPGARLHYELRGAGPLLLMIGSPMGARGFEPIATLLAEDFTVVTYDPRGILNSTVDAPDQEAGPQLLAQDVHGIIAALGRGPAYVFGNSGGATTAVALATRFPKSVRALVAHEPPLLELLPDAGLVRAAIDEICDTYLNESRDAALKKYTNLTGISFRTPGPPPTTSQPAAQNGSAFTPPTDVRAILDRFFRYTLRPTTRYRPDLERLRALGERIVVGGGTTSRGTLYQRCAVALAEQLETALVDFPDDHTGFQREPEPFARLLAQVLAKAG